MAFVVAANLLVASGTSASVSPDSVQVVGLFKGSAVLLIAGKQRLLREGQTSPEGVKLVSTTSASATYQILDQQYTQSLSRATGRYQKPQKKSVIISINANGQYFARGSINRRPVRFLVDTGANSVALNSIDARRLGIDFASGQPTQVGTAGGIVNGYRVILDEVKVGEISVPFVEATVLEGAYPSYILLGTTFLSKVKIVENAGVMELIQ